MIRRQDLWPLGAVGFILAVTASWWALALWPAPGAPEWLERTRSVCFNITESGLPDAKGWLLLLGQPPSMLALLMVGWGSEVRASVAHLRSSRAGWSLLGSVLVLAVGGVGLAGLRVRDAGVPDVVLAEGAMAAEPARLDRAWPEVTGLVDQSGTLFTRARLRGRPALVTFAFGHCETVCPAVVHQSRAARAALDADVAIVVFTLDPWRDTPGRLETLVRQFELDPASDHVVGGAVQAVEAALDAWDVPRERDMRSGDIVHPALVYLVETDGTVPFSSTGATATTLRLAERLGWATTRN